MTTPVQKTEAIGPVAPGAWPIGVDRIRLELKAFFRNREAVVFTFSLPVMLLVLFGSIFQGKVEGTGVEFRQVFIAGIVASGIMSSSFSSLAISIATERHDGTLKRLAGTPMPRAAYFIGKIGLALVTGVLQTGIMLSLGVAFYGLSVPHDVRRWLAFAGLLLLGTACCAVLGIAYSVLPRDGKTAPAVVMPPFLFLQFISGVFFTFSELSHGLQLLASLFPLRWLASGLRYVFLPDTFKVVEPGQSWNVAVGWVVLVVWLVVAFAVCLRTFRFVDERQ